MRNILGLDLGTTSIGWALIKVDNNNRPTEIQDMGVRIVPLAENEGDNFEKGQSVTVNADRTTARGIRRNYDRYQLRRQTLTEKLQKLGMLPDESLIKLPVIDLWQLRANAVTKKVSLPELGRILYHLNQKRGYKHSRMEKNDSKQRANVKEINNRYDELRNSGKTIGQYFAEKLSETAVVHDGKTFYIFRIKDQKLPRKAYEEEYDAIMSCQQTFFPDLLTDKIVDEIKNNIIYYQRDLRSCKHLVSVCDLEKRCFYDADGNVRTNKKGEIVFDGPKVAPRSSPLFQVFKYWQSVNNINFHDRGNDQLYITIEQKRHLAAILDNQEILKKEDTCKLLGNIEESKWYCDKTTKAGIKGNTTKAAILQVLNILPKAKVDELTRFKLETEETKKVDEETGETLVRIKDSYQQEPLYRLWHIIYSIKDDNERLRAISEFLKTYEIEDASIAMSLSNLDFVTSGYANISAKAISKILPYMMEGIGYSHAAEYVGYNPSNIISKEENQKRVLKDQIPQIKKNELHQPTVEKILNQTINIFNKLNEELIKKEERIDEVRIELARELKQSKEERNEAAKGIKAQEDDNKKIAGILIGEGVRPTHNNILKYRLWRESNLSCFYCNQPIKFAEFLKLAEAEREHILPKKLIYDNSFANQVCSCRRCNKEKGGRTAYDYMRTTDKYETYVKKVNLMYDDHKISGKKHSHLLASYDDYLIRKKQGEETTTDIVIWETSIDRQLRLTQYIARKAQEILLTACRDVVATSGSITDLLRHTWGYDTILHELNFLDFKNAELTEIIKDGKTKHEKEVIKGWTKRLDHRHHAIDALTVACTSRSIVQRINTLHASREQIRDEIKTSRQKWKDNNLLEQWIKEKKPFDRRIVLKKVSSILISMKAGKKVTVPGKRKNYKEGKPFVVQSGLRIPRGQLHESTLYGVINHFENGERKEKIVTRYKIGVGRNGYLFTGKESCDVAYDKDRDKFEIKDGIEMVIKKIVDKHIRETIMKRINKAFPDGETYRTEAEKALSEGKEYDGTNRCKKALEQLKDISKRPIYTDKHNIIPIRSVRCFTRLKNVEPLRYNSRNKAIAFVATGNNHHVAIYLDERGEYQKCICTFWQAVERQKHKIPSIIKDPKATWDDIRKRELNGEKFPDSLISSLPSSEYTFKESLQRNDFFVLEMDDKEFNSCIRNNNLAKLSKKLYRIQNISEDEYFLRLHIDPTTERKNAGKVKRLMRKNLNTFMELKPRKVKISLLGKILDYND